MATLSVFLPTLFSCTAYPPASEEKKSSCLLNKEIFIEPDVELYNCPKNMSVKTNSTASKNYNEGK